jgi:hypothetical protein
MACKRASDGIWLSTSAGGRTDLVLLNNCSEGAWNPITRPGDSLILFKSNVKMDDHDAGGLVLGPWTTVATGVRITPSGDVGIGVPYPAQRLHVEGYVQASGYYTGDIFFQKDGRKLWRMFEDEAGLYVENLTNGKNYNVMLQESGNSNSTGDNATIAELKAKNAVLEQMVAELEAKLNMLANKLQ